MLPTGQAINMNPIIDPTRRSSPRSKSPWPAVALWTGLVLGLNGCVSNKRIVLLQDKDASSPAEALVDHTYEATTAPLTLQSGDIISVAVDHNQLTRALEEGIEQRDDRIYQAVQHPYLIGFTVSSGGEVDLPVIGKVEVGGLTLEGAQEAIRKLANNVYSDPSVKVFLLNFNVSVLGEVAQPGRYPMYNERVNVLEALAGAGDMTVLADRSRVRVVRTRDGGNHLYHLDLNDEKTLAGKTFYLQPNDVVIIDPLKRRKFTGRDPGLVLNVLTLLVSIVSVYAVLNR
ncbi:MAG: polysaccharide biosynthesis/export family protein [Flavobacteriales bacterium]